MKRILPAVVALLACAAVAVADTVKTRDGRVLEGRIVREDATKVVIRLRFGGDIEVARRDVLEVVKEDLPEEVVAKKVAALDPADADGLWEVALEARGLRLRKQYIELRDRVLAIDPDHAGANEDAGRVRFEDRWMEPEERDRLLAEREKEAKAEAGLVQYEGEWVTAEEAEARRRGLVKYDGRWMTEAEAKEKQGFVRWKDGWVKAEDLEKIALRDKLQDAAGVPLTVAMSDRFVVVTVYPQVDTDRILLDAESAWAEFASTFGVDPKERLFDDLFTRGPRERRCHIVVLEKDLQYQAFLDGMLRFHKELARILRPERVELMRRQKGFYLVDPDCWIVGYQFPHPKEHSRHSVVHKLSHLMLHRWHFKGVGWTGWWLLEGFGQVQEINALGRCDVFCITTGYGQPKGQEKMLTDSWKDNAKKLVATGGDTNLKDLMLRTLNDLQPYDLVKSWSLVHYLLALDTGKFRDLVRAMKDGEKAYDALPRIYGLSVEEMDRKWRDFVRRTY